jgi:hypothetical protein
LEPEAGTYAHNECDTNADTCCLGKNFVIVEYTRRAADVYSYDKSIKPIENVPIVSGATAWDDPMTGETFILIINEALYYGNKLDHSLINPNQVRHYGINFWDNPYDKVNGTKIDIDDAVTIKLRTIGTKILFESRSPSEQELRNCHKIHITSKREWNPETVALSKIGSSRTDDTVDGLKELMIKAMPRAIAEVSRYDQTLEDLPTRQSYTSHERHAKISAEVLADRFGIGIERARTTLKVTLQRGTRSALLPLSRRYIADRQYGVKRLNGKFATDTMWSKHRSIRSNIATQIFSHKCGFSKPYHLDKADNENVGYALRSFISDFGAPEYLKYDGAPVQVGRKTIFQDAIRKHEIKAHVSGPRRPNENPAEGAIREIKKKWYRIQTQKNIPDRLWDFGIDYVCETSNLTANSSRYSNGRTPIEIITGETPDVSEYLDFGFYDWVSYRANAGLGKPEVGRWLGVSHRVGQLMSYWILTASGRSISCTTVQRITNLEKQTDAYKQRMNDFQKQVEGKWAADGTELTFKDDKPQEFILSLENEDEEFIEEYKRVITDKDLKDAEDVTSKELGIPDPYLDMELGLNRGDELQHATVKRRAMGEDGTPIGVANNNPLLDDRKYEVEFIDGQIEILTANVIAENLLAQVDDEGHRYLLIDEIESHRTTDDAIPRSSGTYHTRSGIKRRKRTTKGWDFYVRWKDGSGDWVKMKDLKDSYPIPLADYAVANAIQDEPAFAWWVPYVMKKRVAIISKVKSKYWQKTHKYGVRVPKNVHEAREIDNKNGNTLWRDAISMEMKNNRVAFEQFDGNPEDLKGYEEITGHLIFDVKLSENFRRKARFVADGHLVETPASVTYSTVVSRESVRLLLLIAALNDLDVMGCDVQNAFLSADNLEKHWLKAGPEFGAEQGKTFIVVRALYGLKSASAAFRAFMAKKLDEIGFKSSPADPDVWLRPAVKPDGEQYYEYVMCYVDDILAISMEATAVLESLKSQKIKFKNDKIEEPEMYLGAKLQKKIINGKAAWTITSVEYIKAAIDTIRGSIKGTKWKIPGTAKTPMQSSFVPELDQTPELNPDDITLYQEMIGMLRWATELGRVDILHEIAILSQYQSSPREGHMEQLLRVFGFLHGKPKLTLYMDTALPVFDYSIFKMEPGEFKEYYRDAEEQLPRLMPRPRGKAVSTMAFVDASHAANKVTRRSHSGHILFVNRAPVKWMSKRQQTVETSAFSSEFIALKHCIEDIEQLRFKLRMFGIPIENDEPTYILCDNEGVVKNSSNVESTLNKKHSAIAYHFARWNVAAGVISVAWIPTGENLADAMTKRLSETSRDYLFGNWTY